MLLSLLCLAGIVAAENVDYTQWVYPLLGSEKGGNAFPGVTRPFGIVKLGPDFFSGVDAYSGYLADGVFIGASLLHEHGTGGAPKYGVVSQMPWTENITNPLGNLTANRTSPDTAYVGYYRLELNNSVSVELAGSEKAGLYRYNFTGTGERNVVVDVSHVLSSYRGQGLGQNYTRGGIEVFDDGHYEANGTYNNGWNRSPDWTVYSCGYFDTAPSAKVFSGTGYNGSYDDGTSVNGTQRLGAVFSFPSNSTSISSRVGVSFISSQQACESLEAEIPSSMSFHDVVEGTKAAWNDQILSKIDIQTTSENEKTLFYSMMYGAFIIPTNKTGENPLWDDGEPYYDDTFTLWDLGRCSTALWHIIQPIFYEEYIRSLINIFRNDGYMPDGRSSFFNGRTQGGSNADNVLADAYVKGVRGSVNWTEGYEAMIKDAEVQPEPNNDPQAPDSSTKEGRGALPDWKDYGFITPNYSRAVSRAVEYAVNDFSLYQVATGLNNTDDAGKYLNRSAQWRNHFNPDSESLGYRGFVVPRALNGSFLEQDPLSCGGCYWGDAYYQALPWEYTFGAIHDISTLVNLTGGPDTFKQRLDTFFAPGNNPKNATGSAQFNFTLMNPSNEPDFDSPYLYHFVGRPDLSLSASRFIAKSYYFANNTGLPGNSDAGAMQTWWLWNSIGLYPITGQNLFLIHAPWFSMNMDLGDGKTLNITVNGGDSDNAYQVQSLQVNGQDWKQNWLTYDDVFAQGGTMHFELGETASDWFDTDNLPPSPGEAGTPKLVTKQ